jgi:hypothetical protein
LFSDPDFKDLRNYILKCNDKFSHLSENEVDENIYMSCFSSFMVQMIDVKTEVLKHVIKELEKKDRERIGKVFNDDFFIKVNEYFIKNITVAIGESYGFTSEQTDQLESMLINRYLLSFTKIAKDRNLLSGNEGSKEDL